MGLNYSPGHYNTVWLLTEFGDNELPKYVVYAKLVNLNFFMSESQQLEKNGGVEVTCLK